MQKGFAPVVGLLTIVIIILVLLGAVLLTRPIDKPVPTTQVTTAMKQISNMPTQASSIVATSTTTPTPTLQIEKDANGWIVVRNEKEGYEYRYPDLKFDYGYLYLNVKVTDTNNTELPSECPVGTFEGWSKDFEGKKVTINANTYCHYTAVQGAAGSIGADEKYTIIKNKKLYSINFTVITHNCQNYCELPDCKKDQRVIDCEKSNKEESDTVEKILSTFKFIR